MHLKISKILISALHQCSAKKYVLFERRFAVCNQPCPSLTGIPTVSGDLALKIVENASQWEALVQQGYKLSGFQIHDDLRHGLAHGAVVFFAFKDTLPVHASMAVLDLAAAVKLDALVGSINAQDAGYIGPCFTALAHRGQGIYPYVLAEICAYLEAKGKSRAFISTKKNNLPSRCGIQKAGFSCVAEALYIRAPRFKHIFLNYNRQDKP